MRFTLGTPGAPPPGTGARDATLPGGPTGAFPGAPPGYPAAPATNPVEAAFGDMTPETAKADGEEGPRLPIRESKLQTILLVAVGAIALTAAGIAVWYKLTDKPAPPTANGDVVLYKGLNLSLEPPARPPWVPDSDTKSKLDAPFIQVYKRENPEAFMAFAARDFKDHEPRPNELREILVQALDKIIEPDPRKEYPDEIEKTWMGRDVTGFKFSGLLKGGGSVEGEAMAVSYKGVGYWFLSWTGSNEIFVEQKPAFKVGREGCKLLDLREKWNPTAAATVAFKNTSIGYTILDSEDAWDPIDDEAEVKGQDPKADKYLAIYKERTKRNKVFHAQLVVAILDVVSDNPLNDARVHVETQVNALADLQGKYVFKEHTDPPEGDPTNPAEKNTTVLRLKATNEKNPSYAKLYAVSGIRVGGKTVALYAWCEWSDRALVDTKLIQIAESLRADK
jgi:hypothetical protein